MGEGAGGVGVKVFIDVISKEAAHRSACRSDKLKGLRASRFAFERSLNSFDLTSDTTNALEELGLLANGVSHDGSFSFADNILHYSIKTVQKLTRAKITMRAGRAWNARRIHPDGRGISRRKATERRARSARAVPLCPIKLFLLDRLDLWCLGP